MSPQLAPAGGVGVRRHGVRALSLRVSLGGATAKTWGDAAQFAIMGAQALKTIRVQDFIGVMTGSCPFCGLGACAAQSLCFTMKVGLTLALRLFALGLSAQTFHLDAQPHGF